MKHPLQAILIAPEEPMRQAVVTGRKTITIREGYRDYRRGPVMLCCHRVPWCVQAEITKVRHVTLRNVTPEEFAADGFDSLDYMLERMRRFYPNLTLDSPVTVIQWKDARGLLVDEASR